MPETWGLLPKSQTDDELIEQAIVRLVTEHNEDESAHLGTGQSLQSHKASEVIDHVAQSIVSDKLKDFETFKLIDYFCDFIPWVSLDGFETDINAGGSLPVAYGAFLYVQTGATSGNYTFLRTRGEWDSLYKSGKITVLEFVISVFNTLRDSTVYLLFTGSSAYPIVETARHVGFKIINGEVWASSADGSTQKLTDTGWSFRPSYIAFPRLKIEFQYGASGFAKFYINDVLKATHTQNLPQDVDAYLRLGAITNEDHSFDFGIHRVMIMRPY